MFLKGSINEYFEPIVENIFLIGKEENIPLEAILDTGFNGMFCMPRKFAHYCELSSLGLETFELADGTLVEEELYVGQIVLNDRAYFVEFTLTDADQALLGMQLLLDKIAVFDLKTMRIEVRE
jgi:predicted aspartyl protease